MDFSTRTIFQSGQLRPIPLTTSSRAFFLPLQLAVSRQHGRRKRGHPSVWIDKRPLDELSCFNAYRLLRHSSSPIYHIFCVQHLTIHDNQYTISSSLPLRLCLHRPSRSSLVRMDDCYFGHSLVHIQLDSLFWRVGAFHAETDSSDQQIIRNQPLLHPRVIHLAVMAGKSSNPGKRRKYRRYSILSHSHPPIPNPSRPVPLAQRQFHQAQEDLAHQYTTTPALQQVDLLPPLVVATNTHFRIPSDRRLQYVMPWSDGAPYQIGDQPYHGQKSQRSTKQVGEFLVK